MSQRAGSSIRRNQAPGHDRTGGIDKLDYHPGRPLVQTDNEADASTRPAGQTHSYAGNFFEQVAEGIYNDDRAQFNREVLRYLGFVWAIINW